MAFLKKKIPTDCPFFDCFCDACGVSFISWNKPKMTCLDCKKEGYIHFKEIKTKEEAKEALRPYREYTRE